MNIYFWITDIFVFLVLRFVYSAELRECKIVFFPSLDEHTQACLWRVKRLLPTWAWGQAIGRHIFYRAELDKYPEHIKARLIRHELEHVRQGLELGVIFPILYLWEYLTKGYEGNRFELEARAAEWDL